jgi:hypothetical protein
MIILYKLSNIAMSKKITSLLKVIAILMVLMAVLMQLQIVIVPALSAYKFWMVIIGFCMVLITSR